MQIIFQPGDVYNKIESILSKCKYSKYIYIDDVKYALYIKMFVAIIDEMFVSKERTYPEGILGLLMPYIQTDALWEDAYKNKDINLNIDVVDSYDPIGRCYYEREVHYKPNDLEIVTVLYDSVLCDLYESFDDVITNTLNKKNMELDPYKLYDVNLVFEKGNRKLGYISVTIKNTDIRDIVFRELYGNRFDDKLHNRYVKSRLPKRPNVIDVSKPITKGMLR